MTKSNPASIQHSLRTYIGETTGIKTVWLFDGVKLPDKKPYISIEQMFTSTEVLSKGKQAVRTLFYYQIGIHTNTIMDRHNLQDVLQRLFLFDKIPFVNASTLETDGYLRIESTDGTPMPADDLVDKTNYHRLYFDVAVDVVYGRNR